MAKDERMKALELALTQIEKDFGKEAIMNKPSTGEGNWEWRLKPDQFSRKEAHEWRKLVQMYGRFGEAIGPEEKK